MDLIKLQQLEGFTEEEINKLFKHRRENKKEYVYVFYHKDKDTFVTYDEDAQFISDITGGPKHCCCVEIERSELINNIKACLDNGKGLIVVDKTFSWDSLKNERRLEYIKGIEFINKCVE